MLSGHCPDCRAGRGVGRRSTRPSTSALAIALLPCARHSSSPQHSPRLLYAAPPPPAFLISHPSASSSLPSPSSHSMTTTYDNRPLPIGGSRVPSGMEEHSDWRSFPEQAVEVLHSSTYGTEYVEAETTRHRLNELKKAISAVLPPIAAIDKNAQLAAMCSSEEKKAEVARLNAGEERRRDDAIAALRLHLQQFPEGSRWGQVVVEVSDKASQAMSKEEFIAFNDYIKVQTTTIFREHGQLLQTMKAIKKKHSTQR